MTRGIPRRSAALRAGFDSGRLIADGVERPPPSPVVAVFQVDANDAKIENSIHRLDDVSRCIAIAGLDGGADRHCDGVSNRFDFTHHHVSPHSLTIRRAASVGNAPTRCPDRRKSHFLEDACAGAIPGVGKQQRLMGFVDLDVDACCVGHRLVVARVVGVLCEFQRSFALEWPLSVDLPERVGRLRL
jgi:hypothetical protein